MANSNWDVVIIGGGVCGCSLLYALSHHRLRVLLIEAENDVGVATTKANSAILHAGYDPEPGTLMAKYNLRGSVLSREICRRLDVLMHEVGSLVVAFGPAEHAAVQALYRRGMDAGVPGLRLLQGEALRTMEPGLSPAVDLALYAPTAAVVNPWELAFAQAEVALRNGAHLLPDTRVVGITRQADGRFLLQTQTANTPFFRAELQAGKQLGVQKNPFDIAKNSEGTARFGVCEKDVKNPDKISGTFSARVVVNAAGIHSGQVAAMAGDDTIAITPSRGQYYLLDKSQGGAARHILFQCPTVRGKGVLVAPTVHGNLICGPNSEAATTTATTAAGLAEVKAFAHKSVPGISFRDSIRNFAGLRAMAAGGDFVVGESRQVPGLYHMAGIKSPGLTAAAAIAEELAGTLVERFGAEEKPAYDERRSVLRFHLLSEADQAAAIAQNPLYGRIVCRCETVTEGEVMDALHRPLPPRSLDAVKRRVGPGMGRCQGGFCGPRVQAIVAQHWDVAQNWVPQDRTGMDVVTQPTKAAACQKDEETTP